MKVDTNTLKAANELEVIKKDLYCTLIEYLPDILGRDEQFLRQFGDVVNISDIDKPLTLLIAAVNDAESSRIQKHPDSVAVLPKICRFLLQGGVPKTFTTALNLSRRVFELEHAMNKPYAVSYLYKGMAQIGMQIIDLGGKNVVRGLSAAAAAGTGAGSSISPIDKAYAYWALTSAAVVKRNINLALQFARQWRTSAEEAKNAGKGMNADDVFRATAAIHLFQLLLGENKATSLANAAHAEPFPLLLGFGEFVFNQPALSTVQATVAANMSPSTLAEDTAHSTLDQNVFPATLTEHMAMDFTKLNIIDEFKALCRLRMILDNEASIKANLTPPQMIDYAHLLARWKLNRPFFEVENVLKSVNYAQCLESIMTRVMGFHAMKEVLNMTPASELSREKPDAVILMMDVRKYSTMCETLPSKEIYDVMNPVFEIMNEELEKVGGMILEFVGDAIMVVFNAFKDQRSDMMSIILSIIQCLKHISVHNSLRLAENAPPLEIGVGIHKGEVTSSFLGGLKRSHLAVLGGTVNIAARIEGMTKELPGKLLVSSACFDDRAPDIWAEPDQVTFSFRDMGFHRVKNIETPVQLYGISPLIRYQVDFFPMGFVAAPEKGIVYIDTGNVCEPGIIDHHYEKHTAKSACALLNQSPELLLGHIEDLHSSEIEFRVHEAPDLDCCATLYIAFELMDKKPRKRELEKLADYLSQIDQGVIPEPDHVANSLYGIFIAHQEKVRKTAQEAARDHQNKQAASPDNQDNYPVPVFSSLDMAMLAAGMRVIDAAMYLMEKNQYDGSFANIFQFSPSWFRVERDLIKNDRLRYREDLKVRSRTYQACINGVQKPVTGLWLDHPQSILFKQWVRNDKGAPGAKGYPFLTVDWSTPDKNRFVISVDPESGTNLNGLGQFLEQHESEKRLKIDKIRPVEPVRQGADNSDPWYFGQGHAYTIIDSPREGTVLTAAEVEAIHKGWNSQI